MTSGTFAGRHQRSGIQTILSMYALTTMGLGARTTATTASWTCWQERTGKYCFQSPPNLRCVAPGLYLLYLTIFTDYDYSYRGDIALISAGSAEWTVEGRWVGGHEGVVRSVDYERVSWPICRVVRSLRCWVRWVLMGIGSSMSPEWRRRW